MFSIYYNDIFFIGSKRSTHSNAYFYGFFKNKRIVLFDTLLKDYESEDERKEREKKIAEKGTEEIEEEKVKDEPSDKEKVKEKKVGKLLLI